MTITITMTAIEVLIEQIHAKMIHCFRERQIDGQWVNRFFAWVKLRRKKNGQLDEKMAEYQIKIISINSK